MKKSIEAARVRAQKFSAMYPNNMVYVFDKKGKKAIISVSDWIWRERILEGWSPVALYKAGKEV